MVLLADNFLAIYEILAKCTVGVKSTVDIELFVILYNIIALHHNTNVSFVEIK